MLFDKFQDTKRAGLEKLSRWCKKDGCVINIIAVLAGDQNLVPSI